MIRRIIKFMFKIILWFFGISILLVIVFKWVPIPLTPLMVIRSLEQKKEDKQITWEHDWVSIEQISKNLQLAVICSEDQNFLTHNGFDFKAIEKAYQHNKKGKGIKGASTITQQTAKNVFLWPQRSWFRKGLESYFTFLIEIFWDKERIIEVYLNSIEMGNGIYGAQAASRYWFNKSAANLTKAEASAIAAILPNPLKYRANSGSVYIQKRKNWILNQMRLYGELEF